MKYKGYKLPIQVCKSLPVRGAWVEISAVNVQTYRFLSLPVRGAWVEIPSAYSVHTQQIVAPRAGSVG